MAKKFYNVKTSQVFHDYYSRLKNIALSLFMWENLPETCNARFLEKCLFEYGMAVFVDDPEMSFLNLKVIPSDTLNVYNEPLGYTAYSTNYSKYYKADDCVIVRNNIMAKSTDSTIMIFAERLAKLSLVHEINIQAQKTPLIIKTDDKTYQSLITLYNQYEGDKPFIVASKSLQDKPIEAIVTGAPFIADKIREEKIAVWNEALEFLGINTNPSDKKKERLIMSEVNSNNEQIDIQCATMQLTREEACEEFYEKFGKVISVRSRIEELTERYHTDYNPDMKEVI